MPRKSYAGAASATTLATAITSSSASLSVANASGYPASADPFVIVIGRGTSSEEKILIGTIASTTMTVATSGRGYDGTTAQAHASGDTVEHCIDAVTIDEVNAHANDDTRDDHSQYLNNTRHDVTARHTFGSAFAAPAAPPAIATSASAGTAGGPARSDHTHALGTGSINNAAMFTAGIAAIGGAITAPGTPANVTTAAATGSATAPARGDHVHGLAAAVAGAGIYLFGGALNVGVDGITIQVNGSDQLEVIPSSGTVPDGYVTTAKLADASVTTAKHVDASVTNAKLAANLPLGWMASAERTTDSANVTSETTIPSLTCAITSAANRRVRVHVYSQRITTDVAATVWVVRLKRDGTTIRTWQGTGSQHLDGLAKDDGVAVGAHSYTISLDVTGSGNATMTASATNPILVEAMDVGGV